MKKAYDYDQRVGIKIPKCKKSFQFVLSNRTLIKEITTKVADQLGYDWISTQMDVYQSGNPRKLIETSTLQQNKIQDGDTLTIEMINMQNKLKQPKYFLQQSKLIDENLYKHYDPGTRSTVYGLILTGFCQETNCCSCTKDVSIALGQGQFGLKDIMDQKCPVCPYKDLGLRKAIIPKKITLSNCAFRVEGLYFNKIGFRNKYETKFEKITGEDHTTLLNILNWQDWVDLQIIVQTL